MKMVLQEASLYYWCGGCTENWYDDIAKYSRESRKELRLHLTRSFLWKWNNVSSIITTLSELTNIYINLEDDIIELYSFNIILNAYIILMDTPVLKSEF
jgi:hypothetical protein